jgi:hypothetical protein
MEPPASDISVPPGEAVKVEPAQVVELAPASMTKPVPIVVRSSAKLVMAADAEVLLFLSVMVRVETPLTGTLVAGLNDLRTEVEDTLILAAAAT